MNPEHYDYYRNIFDGIPLPLAFVDMDLFDANIRAVIERAGGKVVRPASKSLRSIAVLKYLINADAQIRGLMCFTMSEALYLHGQGFDDLLVAYPSIDRSRLQSVARVISDGAQITLMVDCMEQVDAIAVAARAADAVVPLAIDMDLSTSFPLLHFGTRRSPLSSVEAVTDLYDRIRKTKGVRVDGLMGYEAQIAGIGDRVPGKTLENLAVPFLKKLSRPYVRKRRRQVIRALLEAGELRFINGGGTGSLESTAAEKLLTEVTAGSAFFAPHSFDYFNNFKHLPAAGFALEVCRLPTSGMVTCLGGGYVASGVPGKDKLPLPYLPRGLRLTHFEGAGEVQTPLQGRCNLKIGDPVFFRHSKSGELCERFNELYLIRNGAIIDKVNTYRGDNQCFL